MILLKLFWEFLKIGLFSVGGGMATLPFLYDLADSTGWYTYSQLADMLAVSESTPGPVGINMATYVGYTVGGIPGAVLATLGTILPGVILVLILAKFLQKYRDNKYINAAFYGSSPETLKEEIQNTFGIPVDYYILVDPKGFTALVDELGGVDVYIPEDMNYDDPTPGEELHIHYQAGTHHLNGKQALEVARFRHNNDGSGYTDTGRAEMHRQMLVALAKKVVSWNSIPKVTAFVELFQTYVKTDLSASDMLFFATQAMGVDFSSGITQGELTGRGDGVVGNSKWCYVFQPEDILPTLNEQLNPYTRDLTADDLDLPQPDRYLQNY